MRTILLLIFTLVILNLNSADYLNTPESVAYDSFHDCLLVSNKATGEIIRIDKDNRQSIFVKTSFSLRGITIKGNMLYAAADNGIVSVNLDNKESSLFINIPEAEFLNDIAHDFGSYLYVSDTSSGRIYRVNIFQKNYRIETDKIQFPNGLYYDKESNHLYVCCWKEKSPIYSVNLSEGIVDIFRETNYNNLDGLARDQSGKWYFSSWDKGAVLTFSNNKEEPIVVFSDGYDGPADIYYYNNQIVIPEFNANRLKFLTITK